MKHSAGTLRAVRVGLGGARKPSRGGFSSMPVRGRVSAFSSKGLNRMLLCRLEQDVALFAERYLYPPLRREICGLEDHLLLGSHDVVDAQPATLDLTTRLAVRCHKPGTHKGRQPAQARIEFGT